MTMLESCRVWERRNEGGGDLAAVSLCEDFLTNEIIAQDFETSRILSYLTWSF